MITEAIRLSGARSRGSGEFHLSWRHGAPPARWVLAVHGSGRSAQSYSEVPFYRRQRDIVHAAELGFAVVSLGQDVWGRPEGMHDLCLAADWVEGHLGVSRLALWATSAGGSLMFRYAQCFPARVALMLGMFPVWNLEACAGHESCMRVWETEDEAVLKRALEPVNPARFAPPAQPLVICQGLADTVVPAGQHMHMLQALRPLLLHETASDGHSTGAFALYDTPLLSEALCAYAREGNDADRI